MSSVLVVDDEEAMRNCINNSALMRFLMLRGIAHILFGPARKWRNWQTR